MASPVVGLVRVSMAGERIDLAEEFGVALAADLRGAGFDLREAAGVALGAAEVEGAVRELAAAGAAAIVYAIGTWIEPSFVVAAAQGAGLPSVLVANPAPASFGFTGVNILHGAFDRLELPHRVQLGGAGEPGWSEAVVPYLRAAGVAGHFRGATYGLFGGQAPGQYTGSVDLLDARRTFGLEIEQIDELAVVERARAVPDARARELIETELTRFGGVDSPEDVLLRSVKLRIALAEEVAERGLDFVSVKCLGEAFDSYASFCVAAALLNDAGRTVSCQGDIPTTIVMEAMRKLSGEPSFMADLVTLDQRGKLGRLTNCGAGPVTLAARPSAVRWRPQYEYMGRGGGVASSFVMRDGAVTMAGLARMPDTFRLMGAAAVAEERDRAEAEDVRGNWPFAFLRFDGEPRRIVEEVRSNHVAMAYGDHRAELAALADLWGIEGAML
ncbi:MAG: hypothetical protein JST08_03835 [Actinobacteria bacterium]|nr:hypothetical protein [Actinomycetota bacterium]